jgi:hypothetical protein
MSIIHDALKKVQQTNPSASPMPPAPPQEPVPAAAPTQAQDKISIPLLVAVICAIVAMLFAALPQLAPRQITVLKTPPAAAPVPPAAEGQQPAPEPKPAEPAAPSPQDVSKAVANAVAITTAPMPRVIDPNDPISSIQIEGVMDMDGKKAVLISGNVYEEGQTIYGRIISEITFDSLTVIENGQKRTLPIKP